MRKQNLKVSCELDALIELHHSANEKGEWDWNLNINKANDVIPFSAPFYSCIIYQENIIPTGHLPETSNIKKKKGTNEIQRLKR